MISVSLVILMKSFISLREQKSMKNTLNGPIPNMKNGLLNVDIYQEPKEDIGSSLLSISGTFLSISSMLRL